MMITRKQIVIAVASGCCNTRQIARFLNCGSGAISHYFYDMGNNMKRFENGDLLQWEPGKANTLRLGPHVAFIHDEDGEIVDVGRVVDIGDFTRE